jgi:hydrogenase-4 membrane subunit HyfE
MPSFTHSPLALYVLLAFLHVVLLGLLIVRGNWRPCPNFTTYIFLNLVQGAALVFIYGGYGALSPAAEHLAWGTQAAILCARALAINEICRRLLGRYPGIWGLAWRILATLCILLAFFSIASARWKWERIVSSADLGLELTIVAALTALFLFARYYGLIVNRNLRLLSFGFLFLSCVNVLKDAVLTHVAAGYEEMWNLLGAVSFSVTLILWIWSMRQPISAESFAGAPEGRSVYRVLSPEVNLRLQLLNESLRSFFDREAHDS